MNPELAIAAVTHVLKSMLTDGLGDLNVNPAFVSASAGVPSLLQARINLSIIQSNNITIIICNEIYIPLLCCNFTH
jgi:hypothetical protein